MKTNSKPFFILFSKVRKNVLWSLLIFFSTFQLLHSQIIITASDMPAPGDQMPISTRMQPGAAIAGYETAGANVQWNFSNITGNDQQIVKYISATSTEIQYLCIAVFNNPFDPVHDATTARRGQMMTPPAVGGLEITDVFEFFKKTDSTFTMVGRSASINGVPTCIRSNPVDLLYRFPLEYGDTFQSFSEFEINIPSFGYYGQKLWRTSTVDAWGVVHTPLGSFDALRVKSNLQITDSIYYADWGFGIKFPHNETHYIWLTNGLKFPVFTVEVRGPTFGGTIASWADIDQNTIVNDNHSFTDISVFPNPVSDKQLIINVQGNFDNNIDCTLYDIKGMKKMSFLVNQGINTIDISSLTSGVYYLRVDGVQYYQKLIVF